MKKVFYLKTCDTCLKILKQFDLNGWEKREIKTQPITEEEIEKCIKFLNPTKHFSTKNLPK
jgi:arsenate reductase-like glutaredoxin family protein